MNSAIRVEATPQRLAHIVLNLRRCDAEEVGAVNWSMDDLLDKLMAVRSFQWVWEVDGAPAGLMGAWPAWPNVWSVYAMGTDAFPGRAMTKFALRHMMPAMLDVGAHRAQCDSLATHDQAHRWIEGLGGRRESVMPGFGSRGETFIRFAWRRPDGTAQ